MDPTFLPYLDRMLLLAVIVTAALTLSSLLRLAGLWLHEAYAKQRADIEERREKRTIKRHAQSNAELSKLAASMQGRSLGEQLSGIGGALGGAFGQPGSVSYQQPDSTTLLCMRDGCRLHATYCAEHAPAAPQPSGMMQRASRLSWEIQTTNVGHAHRATIAVPLDLWDRVRKFVQDASR